MFSGGSKGNIGKKRVKVILSPKETEQLLRTIIIDISQSIESVCNECVYSILAFSFKKNHFLKNLTIYWMERKLSSILQNSSQSLLTIT